MGRRCVGVSKERPPRAGVEAAIWEADGNLTRPAVRLGCLTATPYLWISELWRWLRKPATEEDRTASEALTEFVRALAEGDETPEVPRYRGVGQRHLPSATPFFVKRGR
jgi:hypothetical protein